MDQQELKIKGFLLYKSNKIPISAKYASKYSLLFKYSDNQDFLGIDGSVNLLIQNNGQSVELGPCRILPNHGPNGYSGRLVFEGDIFDLERFFSTRKLSTLQSPFEDLPLLLSRKEKIKPAFVEYTAKLTYDLNVYKGLFDSLDSQYQDEPEDVKESIQRTIIETEGDKFKRFLDEKLDELEQIVSDFSPEEHQCHGYYFRKQLWDFLLLCPFTARLNLKPRGYQGDSEMMRMIYSNDYQGESTFSKLLHKHSVGHKATQSVRNRIAIVPQVLEGFSSSCPVCSSDGISVLSVGSGPALELENLLRTPPDFDKYRFTLFDQDPLAHSEAATLIHEIEVRFRRSLQVAYLEESVRTMLFSRQPEQRWGQFDFIYSMGLFDYLSAPVARAVFGRLYQLLRSEGEMLIGNFHVSNPSKYYMEYWGDWMLIHRTEQEIRALLQHASFSKVSVFYDDIGTQMFLHLKKK